MAITKTFFGITIQKPGYYGDPADLGTPSWFDRSNYPEYSTYLYYRDFAKFIAKLIGDDFV